MERGEFEEVFNLVEGLEADEEFEVGEGNGDFRLVVRVRVFVWLGFMEFLGEFFVGVDLEGEGFLEGEDLHSCKYAISIYYRMMGWGSIG